MTRHEINEIVEEELEDYIDSVSDIDELYIRTLCQSIRKSVHDPDNMYKAIDLLIHLRDIIYFAPVDLE